MDRDLRSDNGCVIPSVNSLSDLPDLNAMSAADGV
jgi:hypothetical protein